MNQTEQLATQAAHPADQTKLAFAPASALQNRINIDFKKLQSFKGKSAQFKLIDALFRTGLLQVANSVPREAESVPQNR